MVQRFSFPNSEMETKFTYNYHYWRANANIVGIVNKTEKNPKNFG